MGILWTIAALLALYALYGALVPTSYQRRFAGDLAEDETFDGFLKPREVLDPDEPEMTARLVKSFEEDSLKRTANIGRDDPDWHEPHWGHTTGLLQGTLTIDRVDALPDAFRVGLFDKPASYPAVARVGVFRDPELRLAANRLAVKLKFPQPLPNAYAPDGKAEELDLLMAEGENVENGEGHAFFARDARQLDMAAALKSRTGQTFKTLLNWRNLAMLKGVFSEVGRGMKKARNGASASSGWAGKPYYSLGPYALGDGAMKFRMVPRQTHDMPKIDVLKGDPAPPNKTAMNDWLAKGEDAVFDLCVQLATPDCIPTPGPNDPPKAVMAAEYCDLRWDEDLSPFIPVGTLTLRADDALNQQYAWSPLQFNAWNTLPEMRPLGQLFRVRKEVHAAHSNVRVSHLYGDTPGAMVGKCPFAG